MTVEIHAAGDDAPYRVPEPARGAYDQDSRVVKQADGTYRLPSDDGDDWYIEAWLKGDGVLWTARSNDQGYITCEGDRYNRRHKVFDSAEAAIAAIIGEPQS